MRRRAAGIALCSLASVAALGHPVAAADAPPAGWEAEAALSLVTSEDFSGFGVAAGVLRSVGRSFAAGLSVDVIHAGAVATGGGAFRYFFLSTMVAGVAQLRSADRPLTPYVEARIGVAGLSTLEDENTQCRYSTGLAGGVGFGLELSVNRSVAVGARASARMLAGGIACKAVGGQASFDTVLLLALGATVDYHW